MKFALWVTPRGKIHTDTSQMRSDLADIHGSKLDALHGDTPLGAMQMTETREFIKFCLRDEGIPVQRRAEDVLLDAIEKTEKMIPPLRAPTDLECVALCDEQGYLVAKCDASLVNTDPDSNWTGQVRLRITKGKKYKIRVDGVRYRKAFIRPKVKYSREDGIWVEDHDMELVGKDTLVRVIDDEGGERWFRANPAKKGHDFHESELWKYFEKPVVDTVKEVNPDSYNNAMEQMDMLEMINGYKYYPGQRDYIARMNCVDSGLISAETGCGKTLIAITLMRLKGPGRRLVIAPKGTVEGSDSDVDHTAQWLSELDKFAPDLKVYKLFNEKDYNKILAENGGELPKDMVAITYPNAFFSNEGAFEAIPTAWMTRDHESKTRKRLGLPEIEEDESSSISYSRSIGKDINGMRAIWSPSLATKIGDIWDQVYVDEAHFACNINSAVTQSLIRVQAKVRYAITATPIGNMVYNIFPLAGWLMVSKWYRGGLNNPAWPFAKEDIGRFKDLFLSKEFDRTQEQENWRTGKKTSISKDSPVISQPGRLLKSLKPMLGYISKEECNPDLVKCNLMVTKVPMGAQQLDAYAHFIQPENLPFTDPKNRMAVMQNWLRTIAAGGPYGPDFIREHSDLKPTSNYNPKTVMILEKLRECLERKEQCVVIYSRLHSGNEIAARLDKAGVKYSRIDSTQGKHAKEAAIFKAGKRPVMLMGISCAQAYSFENCRNLIIGSLEWSYGKLNQAMGRVYRLNSKRDVNIYTILHKNTIEELVFEKVCTKQDSATICLKGEFVEHDINLMSPEEIMADHVTNFNRNSENIREEICENEWPALCAGIAKFNSEFYTDESKELDPAVNPQKVINQYETV